MKLVPDGWLTPCRRVESPNQDERPAGEAVTLLVVHSISLPPGQYGGDAIERLFTNRLDPAAHPYFREIADLEVSAHFLIRRDGDLVQFVPTTRRAWHAGASSWRGRERCNDFSIRAQRHRPRPQDRSRPGLRLAAPLRRAVAVSHPGRPLNSGRCRRCVTRCRAT